MQSIKTGASALIHVGVSSPAECVLLEQFAYNKHLGLDEAGDAFRFSHWYKLRYSRILQVIYSTIQTCQTLLNT